MPGIVGQSYLQEALTGIFDDFVNAAPASAAEIAPMRDSTSLAVQWMAADSDAIPESQDPVQTVSATASFVDSVRTFERQNDTLAIKTPFRAFIPDRVVAAIDGGDAGALGDAVDIVQSELQRLQDKYWSAHLADTLTALGGLSATAYGSGTIVLTGTGGNLVDCFNTMAEEVRIATGSAEDLVLYIGVPVFQKLLQQNQAFEQQGIAIGTAGTADANIRRLGAAEVGAVEALLATKLIHPVRLVVDRFVNKTAGTHAAQFSTGAYMVQANTIPSRSCLTTLTQPLGGGSGAGPFSVTTAPVGVAEGMQRGVVVGVEAAWNVKRWTTARGVKITTTLA